ncbi:peptide/nickel transport system substrate-binding protein [Kribbella pratensis]|jgi:peptide/nickel transport system substrate-binding protein|uniref:Peptide/nickel transport system substrate-binding protein n=1 Tax=Kribbella pratensis TaxID=2512112 RepID=A0ABY2F906_9ACTN|nr:ABC transporter substrate-binding protein [Kribbella pratensis]TDW86994.1 peptide/nickel transport system substrate-binding protein [Kribbella pratensis]
MRARRTVALALTGLLAAAALAACSSGDGQSGSSGNNGSGTAATVLNIGMPNGPQTENHNPFLGSSSGASLGYRWMIFEPLVMINGIKPTEPGKPWLATEWKWDANYTKLSLTVREGVKFSDGQPMTADDVAYSFQIRKDNEGLNQDAIPYGTITASGNKVDLTFTRSQFTNQNKILTVFVIPKHQWSTIKDPSQDTLKSPIGTGPYTVKSFTPQTTTLTLRDSYWQDLPKVKELRYTSYNDNNAQTTALANGASEWSFVFVPNVKAVFQDKDPKNHKLWFPANLGIHGLWINTTRKPFDNPALRRAMNLVINRDDIFQQGEAGYFYPKVESMTGIPTPAGESFIAPEYKDLKHKVDVEAAKKELTDAGFKLEGDALKDPTGKPVTITLTDPAGWSDYITDLEIIKDNLSTIGIKATVDKANQDAWFKNIDEGNFDAAMHWTNGGATPYDIYQNIMDGKILKPVGKGGVSGNYGRFNSPEATKALDQYANAADDAARTTALNTLQKIMVEQMPIIPTSASNVGGLYSTKNWVGWPDEQNQYGPAQPTQQNALQIILNLKPAGTQ